MAARERWTYNTEDNMILLRLYGEMTERARVERRWTSWSELAGLFEQRAGRRMPPVALRYRVNYNKLVWSRWRDFKNLGGQVAWNSTTGQISGDEAWWASMKQVTYFW